MKTPEYATQNLRSVNSTLLTDIFRQYLNQIVDIYTGKI